MNQYDNYRSMRPMLASAAVVLVLVFVVSAALPVAGAVAPVGRAGDPRMPLVEDIYLYEPNGAQRTLDNSPSSLFSDPSRRQIIASGHLENSIYVIDADNRKQTAVFDITSVPRQVQGLALAYDHRNYRLLFGEKDTAAHSIIARKVDRIKVPRQIHAVDLRTGSMSSFAFPAEFEGQGVRSISYDATRDVVFAVTELQLPPSVAGTTGARELFLHAIDASKLVTDPSKAWLWAYEIPQICLQFLGGAGVATTPYLGVSTDGSVVYFACRGFPDPSTFVLNASAGLNGIDPTQNGALVLELNWPAVAAQPGVVPEFFPFAGALFNGFATGDHAGNRLVIVPSGGTQNKVFVFDAVHRAWIGAFPLGNGNVTGGTTDQRTGRLYLFDDASGIALSDLGVVPVSQGIKIDEGTDFTYQQPAFDPLTRQLFAAGSVWRNGPPSHIRVYEDRTPSLERPSPRDPDSDTHQIEEADAVDVTYTGGGGAFGARLMWVGGLNRMPFGQTVIGGIPDERARPSGSDRGAFSAFVRAAQLEGSRSSGSATADAMGLYIDDSTRADVERVPGGAEILSSVVGEANPSGCRDLGDDRSASTSAGSRATCKEGAETAASAWSSEKMEASPVKVAWATSSVTLRRDPELGIVTKSAAAARGVEIPLGPAGTIRIGEIRASAETWAKGRTGSADSRYRSLATAVTVTDAAGKETVLCDAQCDIPALSREINTRFMNRVQAEAGQPGDDAATTRSPGGARAILAKDNYSYWSGFNVNGDDRQEVPALQLTVFIDGAQPSRFILQLAAVRAESQYKIGAPKPPDVIEPTKLVLKLIDDVGDALPGGVFEVRPAEAGDLGVLGDLDSDLAGTCITDDDGVGDCTFDDLPPGDYTVTQVTAPAGYAAAEGTTVTLSPGFLTEVVFTNLRAIGAITVSLTDDGEEPKPLPGAEFAVYADDGDLALGEADVLYDECTTDGDGACAFDEVPLGAYVVTQTAAPPEYLMADDVGFALEAPGQAANLTFVTGLTPIPPTPGTPGTEAEEFIDDELGDTARVDAPTETTTVIVNSPPMQPAAQVTSSPLPSNGGGVRQLLSLPADTVNYLARKPMQALLFGLLWILLGAPLYLLVRRRSLTLVKAVS